MREVQEQKKPFPVLADEVFERLKAYLKKNVWWLDQTFGRTWKINRSVGGKSYIEPCVYTGKGNEYETLMPSSDLGNYSFFVLRDPSYINGKGVVKVKFSLIVWCDLRTTFEEDTTPVSVSATLSNPTTSTINVKINYEVGVRELVSKGFLWGLNAEEQTNEVVMAGDEYTLEGLDSDAMYFVKPFVTTDKATTYGEVVSGRTKAVPLILLTSAVSGIDENTATLNGSVIGDVVECGFVYATHDEPTIDDTKVVCEVVASEIQTIVSGLTENTLYYVRVYAIVNGVAQYGDEENFTTQLINPLLVTDPATNITADSFIANGLIFDYNRPLLDMGIVYGSAQYPVIGVGDAVKVTVDELDNYRLKKVVDNIESETDLYYRTFGTKQNNLTLYSLNSEKCYNAIPFELNNYIGLRIADNTSVSFAFSISNLNFIYSQYTYLKFKYHAFNTQSILKIGNEGQMLTYQDKRILTWNYNANRFYTSDGLVYPANGGYSGNVEHKNGNLYGEYWDIKGNSYTSGQRTDTSATVPEFLQPYGTLKIAYVNNSRAAYNNCLFGEMICADGINDDGTFDNLRFHFVPAKAKINLPEDKEWNGNPITIGDCGYYDMVSKKFKKFPYQTNAKWDLFTDRYYEKLLLD